MSTEKYELNSIVYNTTGWNVIVRDNFERLDDDIHSRRLVVLGVNVEAYQLGYIYHDGTWYPAKADGIKQPCLGMFLESGSAGDTIRVQRKGDIENDVWSLTPGALCYLSDSTYGCITQSKPIYNAQIIGIALTSTIIYLDIQIVMEDFVTATTTTTTTTTTSLSTSSSSSTTSTSSSSTTSTSASSTSTTSTASTSSTSSTSSTISTTSSTASTTSTFSTTTSTSSTASTTSISTSTNSTTSTSASTTTSSTASTTSTFSTTSSTSSTASTTSTYSTTSSTSSTASTTSTHSTTSSTSTFSTTSSTSSTASTTSTYSTTSSTSSTASTTSTHSTTSSTSTFSTTSSTSSTASTTSTQSSTTSSTSSSTTTTTVSVDIYTKTLLHFNGTDGSTTINDEYDKTWTAQGNAQLDTAQKKFGTASLYLDGSGDYISTADSDDFCFSSGSFTIDFWFRMNAYPTTNNMVFAHGNNPTEPYYHIRIYTSGGKYYTQLAFFQSGDDAYCTAEISLTLNTWHHVAFVRNGNYITCYFNGSQVAQIETSITIANASGNALIGAWYSSGSPGFHYKGWIDEFRISKGIARWTENFTPPTSEYE